MLQRVLSRFPSGIGADFRAGPLLTAVGSVLPLLTGMAFLMLGYGLQGSLLGVRATAEGFSSTVTGIVMASYFCGFLIGSRIAPPIIRRVGHLRVFAAATCCVTLAILVHSLYVTPLVWGLMRIVTGFSMASAYIVTESWLNDRIDNAHRGGLLAIYMVVSYFGIAFGQLLLGTAPPTQTDLFIVCACLATMSAIPILLSLVPQPAQENAESLSLAELYRVSPLGLVGTFLSSIIQGTVFGMGAVYARQSGLSISETSYFMFLLILGGALLQWPFGKLSDRVDRRKAIAGLALFGAAATVATAIAERASPSLLVVFAPLLGLSPLLLYSLLIAYTNDHLRPEQMVAASSALTLVFGLGAMTGPPAVGVLMDAFGRSGFLWVLTLAQLALLAFTVYRMSQRASMPVEEQSSYQGAPALSPPSGEWARDKAPTEAKMPST